MSRRPAAITQADVARAIRACRKAGLTVARVVVRSDGVSIEAIDHDGQPTTFPGPLESQPEVVL